VAGLTGALKIRHVEPQVRPQGNGKDVIDLGCRGQPDAIGFDLAQRITPQLHQPELAPGAIVPALVRRSARMLGAATGIDQRWASWLGAPPLRRMGHRKNRVAATCHWYRQLAAYDRSETYEEMHFSSCQPATRILWRLRSPHDGASFDV
jgi:hypothetical protein